MSEFWEWAVAAYAGEGVAEACLTLQDDHGQCVPLLLWAAWRAARGQGVQAAEAAALARTWSDEAIAPLRAVRRRLKTPLSSEDDARRLPLREQVKAAELVAERALMGLLEALPAREKTAHQTAEDLCRAHLDACAHAWGEKMPPEARDRLCQALTKGDFLRYNASSQGA